MSIVESQVVDVIRPCPFCGSRAELIHDTTSDYSQHHSWEVVCTDPNYWQQSPDDSRECCGISGPNRKTREAAIAAWNVGAIGEPSTPAIRYIAIDPTLK
jgi:hypothetical protein